MVLERLTDDKAEGKHSVTVTGRLVKPGLKMESDYKVTVEILEGIEKEQPFAPIAEKDTDPAAANGALTDSALKEDDSKDLSKSQELDMQESGIVATGEEKTTPEETTDTSDEAE